MPRSNKFNRKINNLIASLRGLPADYSKAYWRKDVTLNQVMDQIIHRFQVEETRIEELIASEWPSLVGEKNAVYSQPLRLDRGQRLYIAVSNPVIKQEMQFRKKVILQRLHKIPGCEGISLLVFRAG